MKDIEFMSSTKELLEHILAGINAERERILNILDRESDALIAAGDTDSDCLFMLSRLIDEIGVSK